MAGNKKQIKITILFPKDGELEEVDAAVDKINKSHIAKYGAELTRAQAGRQALLNWARAINKIK